MGPVTRQLANSYVDIIRGKNEKYGTWCTPVLRKLTATSKDKVKGPVAEPPGLSEYRSPSPSSCCRGVRSCPRGSSCGTRR